MEDMAIGSSKTPYWPLSLTTHAAANPPRDAKPSCLRVCCMSVLSLVACIIIFVAIVFAYLVFQSVVTDRNPEIKIQSVSVCLDNILNDPSRMMAQWNITFSVDNVYLGNVDYKDMQVSVQCMASSPTTKSVEFPAAGLHQRWNSFDPDFLNLSVNTSLPFSNVTNLALLFNVNFQSHFKYKNLVCTYNWLLNSTCGGMMVELVSSPGPPGRCGVMSGYTKGPVLCLDSLRVKSMGG